MKEEREGMARTSELDPTDKDVRGHPCISTNIKGDFVRRPPIEEKRIKNPV